MIVLGFDTSNYTTSIAAYDGGRGHNCSRLLDVRPGELGLRQSDALFSHMKRLPALAAQLMDEIGACDDVVALGVSTRPRAVEGSYMPCFLAGESQARVLASVLNVPVYSFSHQQGHIAAACWGAERMDLLKTPHLAWHLSGGTTELLLVEPELRAVCIGGTTDLSAGQLIDRTGQMLGLDFPAGKAIDRLSAGSDSADLFRVRVDGAQFSLSGVQNKLREFFEKTGDPAATARYCLRSIIHAVRKATKQALDEHPGLPVVFSGGVASNSMLREAFAGLDAVFCSPAYSTDNAMGIAVLTWEAYHGA
jgi:Metal-dependent proteases with possible chaperone activity